jgi:hypothetical protein
VQEPPPGEKPPVEEPPDPERPPVVETGGPLAPPAIMTATGQAPDAEEGRSVARSYLGKQVTWSGRLAEPAVEDAGQLRLYLRCGADGSVLVRVCARPFPRSERLERGDPITVTGTIEKVDALYIGVGEATVLSAPARRP